MGYWGIACRAVAPFHKLIVLQEWHPERQDFTQLVATCQKAQLYEYLGLNNYPYHFQVRTFEASASISILGMWHRTLGIYSGSYRCHISSAPSVQANAVSESAESSLVASEATEPHVDASHLEVSVKSRAHSGVFVHPCRKKRASLSCQSAAWYAMQNGGCFQNPAWNTNRLRIFLGSQKTTETYGSSYTTVFGIPFVLNLTCRLTPYPFFWLPNYNSGVRIPKPTVGYPNKGVWYEPTGRTRIQDHHVLRGHLEPYPKVPSTQMETIYPKPSERVPI